MKILFINLPYHGHVVPTIGLVQELIKRGCEVTYLMPFDWKDKVAESGAKFAGYQNHKQLSEQIKNAYAAAEEIVEQFDFIVYEQFFFLGKHLADKYYKPAVRIFTAPVANKLLMEKYISKGPLSVFKYKWIARAFTQDVAKGIPLKTDNWLDEIIYNPPRLNFVYTLREYQPYEAEFPEEHYKFLGPSVYKRKEEPLVYVKGKNPVVYISLGTVIKGKLSFFQNCVEAFCDETVDVIISVGKKFDKKKLKRVPSNVFIYDTVPQLEVLKIADVFITHGGMNSISESLVYGTPMVVIPFVSDQIVNARCVERLGVGKYLPYSDVNKSSIKQTVLSVLSDAEMENRIIKVQECIRKAPGNAGGAEMIIRYYENLNNM